MLERTVEPITNRKILRAGKKALRMTIDYEEADGR
jgi:hypothetical protein